MFDQTLTEFNHVALEAVKNGLKAAGFVLVKRDYSEYYEEYSHPNFPGYVYSIGQTDFDRPDCHIDIRTWHKDNSPR